MDNNKKSIRDKIISRVESHTTLIWAVIGLLFMAYAGYIYYHDVYIPSNSEPLSTVQIPTVKRSALNQIVKDLNQRKEKGIESIDKETPDLFKISTQ